MADAEIADPLAFGEPSKPLDDGLPPHADASMARAAVVTTVTAARVAAGSHVRRGRRMARVLLFKVVSSGPDDRDDRRRRLCRQMLQSAWVGDRRAARMAGRSPARAPMKRAAARPPAQASAGMTTAQPLTSA